MTYLLFASLLWAFSFGLIKQHLVGLDPTLVACIRVWFSFLLLLPFFRPGRVGAGTAAQLVLIGAVQYGVMYVAYIRSYQYLPAHQVALFTVFTPIYVALVHGALERRFRARMLMIALLAVAGTAVIAYKTPDVGGAMAGIGLLQVSGICFASGQVGYRRVMVAFCATQTRPRDREVFAWLYLGAVILTTAVLLWRVDLAAERVSAEQWWVLAYLGILPSGVGFFLWNVGATRVEAGTLAVLNNAKVPLGVLAAVIVFGERPDVLRLLVGGLVIGLAVAINEGLVRSRAAHSPAETSEG